METSLPGRSRASLGNKEAEATYKAEDSQDLTRGHRASHGFKNSEPMGAVC